MAIHWGTYNGHLRVGIAYTISPSAPSYTDTTVDITWKFYVGSDGWSFNDSQTLHVDATDWAGASEDFYNDLSGGSKLVFTKKITYPISFNSGTENANCNLTGAYNGATPSKSLTVQKPDRPPGVPGQVVTDAASSVDGDSALLSWTAPASNGATIDKYQARVDNNSGFGSITVSDSAIATTSWNTGNVLDNNTTYYFQVRAHNAAGWGPWSTTKNFTTSGGNPSAPGTPTKLDATETTLRFGWAKSNANGGTGLDYDVELYSDAGLTTLVSSATNVVTTYHEFTGLTASTQYWCRVRAQTSLGTSGWSPTGTATTYDPASYTDPGPFTQQVNNFAEAVADKFCHLGMGAMRERTASLATTTGTPAHLTFGGSSYSGGPDAPTHLTTHASLSYYTWEVNYEGLYLIELATKWTSGDYRVLHGITVNDAALPNSGTGWPAGTLDKQYWAGDTADAVIQTSVAVRLSVGDVVGFYVQQNSGANQSVAAEGSVTNLAAWARIAMIGF